MIKYYQHTEIDKTKWDACIESASNSLMYAYSWYLDIVSPGWDALVLGNYEAVMPLPWKNKHGLRYIYQPPYCQQLGVFSSKEELLKTADEFIRKIPTKFIHVHANFNTGNGFSEKTNKRLKLNNTCELDLSLTYEQLYSQFSKNHKKNIKQAAKNDYKIEDIGVDLAVELYVDYYKTKGLVAKFPFVISVFPQLVKEWQEQCKVETRGLFLDDSLVASYILIEKNNRFVMHTSMNDVGRKKRGVYYLINSIIERNSGTNKVLDFAGSNIEAIHYRNMGFGAKESNYYSMFYYFNQLFSRRSF